jgi:hypothetical protein
MVRAALGFVIGAVVWMPVFFILAIGLTLMSPDYAVHARTWMSAGVFEFTAPQAAANVVLWVLSEAFAGWLAVVVARRREAAWALAAVVLLYLGTLHIVLYWPRFPWWYNVAVVVTAAPAVLFGGRLACRFVARGSAATAA